MTDPLETPAPNAARAATWRRYLRFWGPRAEADVDDELAFHIDMRARDYVERGLTEPDARLAATRRLGDLATARAECIAITARRERRMTRAQLIDAFAQDVQFAWRTLRRQKGWTAVAVITLALGIGANTAVFSVVNTLFLHPLTYPNADRMAFIYEEPTEGNNTGMTVMITPPASVVRTWRQASRSFEAIEAYSSSDRALRTNDGAPVSVRTAMVLPSFGTFVGARPIIGREFTEADIAEGGAVAVLSEPFWRSRYGGDRGIIGKPITLDNQPYTVIGVMPIGYRLPRLTEAVSDVWFPLDLRREGLGLAMIGRLRPRVELAAAARELDSLHVRSTNVAASRGSAMKFRVKLASPQELVGFRQSLLLLSLAVALVLLIACGNVAHLLLARTASRQRELAIRGALGASRLRLVRQLLTESLILAAAGCVGGVMVGWAGLHLLVALRPASLPELAEARVDGLTLLMTAAIAAATGLAVGIVGAFQSGRLVAHDALKAGATSVSQSRRQRHVRSSLVVSEMALSTVLLVGATLLVRSIIHLQTTDPGFNPSRLYALQIGLPQSRYTTATARTVFLSALSDRVRRVPGVVAATVAASSPPSRSFMIGALQIEGDPPPAPGTSSFVDYNGVEPDYFTMMGIRLLEGTTITDTTKAASQALVNEGFAKKYWPGKSALGHRVRVVYNGEGDWRTIVGVAADALTSGLTGDASRPMLYMSSTDRFQPVLLIRTAAGTDPMPAVRSLVLQADAALPPPNVTNVEDAMSRSASGPRFTMMLLVVFTLLALVLAAVGLYGVMAYAVAQQTREIGIRIALGATRGAIAKAVLSRGVIMAVAGAAIGVIGARWGSKLLEHMLYGVTRNDAASFTIGVVVLIVTAVVACLVPMRRAVSVDPLVSIRAD